MADGGKRQYIFRVGQPAAVLRVAADGHSGVLHVHLEESQLPEGAGRADPQWRQSCAAVQDESDHHDHVRGGAVRAVVATAVPGVLAHKVLHAAARGREVHHRLSTHRPVAGSRELVHQPAAVRHI